MPSSTHTDRYKTFFYHKGVKYIARLWDHHDRAVKMRDKIIKTEEEKAKNDVH